MASRARPTTTRERFRAQIRDEIKAAALRQLAAGGPHAVSLNAIAKELGVSGPALYRYVPSRDALLTELVLDAYGDLAAALERAVARADGEPLRAFARAYRAWAIAQPHRYGLLFVPPLPGLDAHEDRLVEAAQPAMSTLLGVLGAGADTPDGPLAEQLAGWARRRGADVAPGVALRGVLAWSRLHGLVSLELAGNYASMGLDPERLLEAELAALAG